MNCNCIWVEGILSVLIILFVFWQTTYSQWIIAIAATLLLLHALICKNCKMCKECSNLNGMVSSRPKNKSRRK